MTLTTHYSLLTTHYYYNDYDYDYNVYMLHTYIHTCTWYPILLPNSYASLHLLLLLLLAVLLRLRSSKRHTAVPNAEAHFKKAWLA